MRNFVGWRYIIAIALPLLLASLGVISMTTDLLNQVAGNADRAEEERNRAIAVRLLKNAEADLVRITSQNARWDGAAAHIYPEIDAQWLRSTWGSINSIGHSYDRVVVFDQATGQVHFTVLRQRTENPTWPSARLAEELTTRLGKAVSTTTLRQMLHRAREKFAELILDEVTQSLADPTEEKLADELIVLGLIEYCRSALKRRTSE